MKKAPRSSPNSAVIEPTLPESVAKNRRSAGSHRRSTPSGEQLEGEPVSRWLTQRETAQLLGISTRWLQKLEERGMPADGHRGDCRYAIPHTVVWWLQWRRVKDSGEPLAQLPFRVALARHRLSAAIEDAVAAYRIATDPLYAKLYEGGDRSDADMRALRGRIRARDGESPGPWTFERRLFAPLMPEDRERDARGGDDEEDVA